MVLVENGDEFFCFLPFGFLNSGFRLDGFLIRRFRPCDFPVGRSRLCRFLIGRFLLSRFPNNRFLFSRFLTCEFLSCEFLSCEFLAYEFLACEFLICESLISSSSSGSFLISRSPSGSFLIGRIRICSSRSGNQISGTVLTCRPAGTCSPVREIRSRDGLVGRFGLTVFWPGALFGFLGLLPGQLPVELLLLRIELAEGSLELQRPTHVPPVAKTRDDLIALRRAQGALARLEIELGELESPLVAQVVPRHLL